MPHVTRTTPEKLLANGKTIRRFNFCQLTRNEDLLLNDTLEFRIERAGSFNGMIGWFHTDLAEGIGLSTSPSAPATRLEEFIPPVGDTARCERGRYHRGQDRGPAIRTQHDLDLADANVTEGSGLRTGPLQSNFHNMRLTREMARHLYTNDATPKRSEQDDVRLFILQNCDGINTMARLAEMVQAPIRDSLPQPGRCDDQGCGRYETLSPFGLSLGFEEASEVVAGEDLLPKRGAMEIESAFQH